MDEETNQNHKIIIESYTEYSQAVAALDEQILAAELISTNISELASAIHAYEQHNEINTQDVT